MFSQAGVENTPGLGALRPGLGAASPGSRGAELFLRCVCCVQAGPRRVRRRRRPLLCRGAAASASGSTCGWASASSP